MQDLLDENITDQKNTLQFHSWVLLIWGSVFVIGYLFWFMHWPWNSILRMIGAGGFITYSLSFLILIKQRTIPIIISNGIGLLWILIILWGEFFNDGYPFNGQGLIVQAVILAISFLIHWAVLLPIKKGRVRNK